MGDGTLCHLVRTYDDDRTNQNPLCGGYQAHRCRGTGAYAAFANPGFLQERLYKFATEVPAQLGLKFVDVVPIILDKNQAKLQLGGAAASYVLGRITGQGKYSNELQTKVGLNADSVFYMGIKISNNFYNHGDAGKSEQNTMIGHAVAASTLVFVVLVTALFFITDISLGLFIALLPLFVMVYFFGKIGQGMLMAYIKTILTFMFTILFAAIVVGVCSLLLVIIPGLSAVADGANPISGRTAYAFIATLWVCIVFLKFVPQYAANITGITVNSAYEMGHSIEHAGFAQKGPKDKDKPKKGGDK